jgi:hypothetical protein
MKRAILAVSSLLAALPACSDSSTEFWLPANNLLQMNSTNSPIMAMRNTLAFVETTSSTTFVLDPADPTLVPKLVPVGKRPVKATRHKGDGEDRLFVLTDGDRGSADKDPVSPQLFLVDPREALAADAQTPYVPWQTALPTRFDDIVQSADGRFALLLHNTSTGSSGDDTLFNPNDFMVVDFAAGVAGTPTVYERSIRSLGGAPTDIRFSPAFGDHRLAVVLSSSYVTIFDLVRKEQSEISMPLCLASSCSYQVQDVVFDPWSFGVNGTFNIYIRAAGAKDIFQISLSESADRPGFLSPSPSMLGVGAAVSDMTIYTTTTGKVRLAVLTASNLAIVDPSTSNSITVALPMSANRIIPFADASGKSQAMLVSLSGGSNSVVFVDLASAEDIGSSAPKQIPVSGTVSEVTIVSRPTDSDPAAPNVAVLTFANKGAGPVRSVVKLDSQSFFDYSAGSQLVSPYLEVRSADHGARLWSVTTPSTGTASPSSGIYYRDMPTAVGSVPDTVWLDQSIQSMIALEAPSGGTRYLVLQHSDELGGGNLTLVDADNPSRATARTASGFLFANYLGRTQP